MNEQIEVPELNDPRVLRYVAVEGYRLLTWDTGGRMQTGQYRIGYAFYAPNATEPLFCGDDFGCSPMDAIDSDACLRGLLGFLTLRPGDTDREYFDGYSEAQMAFAQGDAEYLQLWTLEDADTPEFVDLTEA